MERSDLSRRKFIRNTVGPDGIVVGMDSLDVVNSNLDILRNFKPMDEKRMKEMALQLTPFYNHQNLPWMAPGYHDGRWA